MLNSQKIINIITSTSFTKREAEAVVYLIKERKLSIFALSRLMKISRPSIYLIINSLLKRKVVSPINFGKRTIYGLHKNFDLGSLYKTSIYEINKIPELNKIKTSDIEILPTFSNLNEFLDLALKLTRGEVVYSIETPEDINDLFSKTSISWLKQWQSKIARKGIVLKGLSNPKGLDVFQKSAKKLFELLSKRSGSARFLEELEVRMSVVSFRDYVCFFSRSKNKFFVIKDSDLSVTIQSILDFVFNLSEYKNIYTPN
ncbi:hypothetical protein IT397_03130 [Candidatus Nomurabacteria bacterium]|nr:hypothetical protein [Candidatus Nomurabacteria bacterium]